MTTLRTVSALAGWGAPVGNHITDTATHAAAQRRGNFMGSSSNGSVTLGSRRGVGTPSILLPTAKR